MVEVFLDGQRIGLDETWRVKVPCEPLNEWLGITPHFGVDENRQITLDGRFTITHIPTGWSLPDGSACYSCCRYYGMKIAALGLDWSTVTPDNAKAWRLTLSVHEQEVIVLAHGLAWRCDAEECEYEDAD